MDKIEHLSSYAHVVHTSEKKVISRRRKNENVFTMSKDEKCTCKACKNTVFHCQICKFLGFLFPSSSWLLKLPIVLLQDEKAKTLIITRVPWAQSESGAAETMDTSNFDNFSKISDYLLLVQ